MTPPSSAGAPSSGPRAAPTAPRLEAAHLSKHFGTAQVLDDVSIAVGPGECHALVGQNGSGKSTVVKILAGVHRPDGGELRVDGAALHLPAGPPDLFAAGVSFVHQDLGVLDGISVLENMCVGRFTVTGPSRRIAWRAHLAEAESVLDRVGLHVDPRRLVDGLNREQKTLVAIGRALMGQRAGAGIVVLDEPTRALPPGRLEAFHAVIRNIAGAGGAVLLITHNLAEVMSVADQVTVLRDGRVAAAAIAVRRTSESAIARAMLGFDLRASVSKSIPAAGARVQVSDVSGRNVDHACFEIGAGEILGLTGRPGSGFGELPYLLSAVEPASGGCLRIDNDDIDLASQSVSALLNKGVVLIPESRVTQGVALDMSIADNISLPRLASKGRRLYTGRRWRDQETASAIRALDIRPADPLRLLRVLSGGNQQKVLLGKWLASRPRLLILHEPTQAVDVGARVEILDAIRREAERGTSVLLVTVEAADLHALCHRVAIFDRGRLQTILTPGSAHEIVDAIYAAPGRSANQKTGAP